MVGVIWAPKAEQDLYQIIDYIAQDSPSYASLFYDQLHEKVKNLSNFPLMGRKVPELDDSNIREIIIGNYRLIYRISNEALQIVRIIHGSRILDFK